MLLRNILLAVGVVALIAGVSLAGLWLGQGTLAPGTAGAERAVGGIAEPAPGAAPPGDTKSIMAAARAIPAGSLLRAEDVAWKSVPLAAETPGAILREPASETAFFGAIARRDFAAGEPLVATLLLKPTDRGFLSAVLSPGTRAVSIPVDASQSASGLLLPDDRVDLILTQTFVLNADPARKSVGETLLRDLRVIAVDQRLIPNAQAGEAGASTPQTPMPRTITLEASERQAEMLMVASRLGEVGIVVRALERTEAAAAGAGPSAPVWASDVSPALKQLGSAPAPAQGAATPAPSPRPVVEVMHGSRLEAR